MKTRGDVDARGFRWPLAALERKCGNELDAACMQLAQARREALAVDSRVRKLAQACVEGERALAVGARIDLGLRLGALHYLVDMQERVRRLGAEAAGLRRQVETAASKCLDADRRLASVGELRQAALGILAAQQRRRQARDADLAWLATLASRRSRALEGEDA